MMTEYSPADKINENESPEPLLPRSAWNSQVAYLRAIFRAKKALDLVDQEQQNKAISLSPKSQLQC